MNEGKPDFYSDLLKTFDTLSLDSIHERRMASKPLYDFFMLLLKEVAITFLDLDKNSLSTYQLKTRWENIKRHYLYSIQYSRGKILSSEFVVNFK